MIGAAVARILCILVGHIYPLWKTFQACHLPDGVTMMEGSKLVEIRRVLAFWAVHGAFTFAEYFVDFFVWWIPLYFEAKVLFLLWLVQGNFNGAIFVFDNLICEVFCHHETDIDASLEKSKAALKQSGGKAVHMLFDGAASIVALAMRKVTFLLFLASFSHFKVYYLVASSPACLCAALMILTDFSRSRMQWF